jgi:hypothetical protein
MQYVVAEEKFSARQNLRIDVLPASSIFPHVIPTSMIEIPIWPQIESLQKKLKSNEHIWMALPMV